MLAAQLVAGDCRVGPAAPGWAGERRLAYNSENQETRSLAEIMDALKGASAHMINRRLGRKGKVWQEESFDRVLRSSESLDEKIAYILNNPVRKGLVSRPEDYPWLWTATGELRSPAQPGAAGPT